MFECVYESEIMAVKLTDKNIIMYAMKHYENVQCVDISDFYDDLKRINYIKRLFVRYKKTGQLKDRLILNHLIILYNVFSVEAATNILFFKIEREYWPQLKTFLVYLNYMPEKLTFLNTCDIITSDIPLDQTIISILRNL
ncbi:hypothetical protein UFOVP410_72 [uncultured Caudovirales phage]|uniref:Uncharacterized protein n=1 Tax=uncultured Caudovirales phage TaxID=2100421 RepID=A0A6J5M762_9CAUD|nr:hypothetical protein UFOVP410_72 [uncultured Caudovirales phage]